MTYTTLSVTTRSRAVHEDASDSVTGTIPLEDAITALLKLTIGEQLQKSHRTQEAYRHRSSL